MWFSRSFVEIDVSVTTYNLPRRAYGAILCSGIECCAIHGPAEGLALPAADRHSRGLKDSLPTPLVTGKCNLPIAKS